MLRILTAIALILPLAAQQAPPPAAAKPTVLNPAAAKPTGPQGTVSGLVVWRGSKAPIEGAQLQMVGPNGSQNAMRSNPEGKFEVKVPPGGYQITVRLVGQSGFIGVPTVKVVTVRDNDTTKVEIEMPQAAQLSGRVLNPRGEPVQGARVTLLMRSYEVWSTNLVYWNTPFGAQTNDLGEYSLEGIPTDVAFHAFAEVVTPGTAEALATNAADPDARRPILAGTFYPQALDPGGALAFTLSEGEHRENLDIRMVQTKSYCAEDVLLPVPQEDLAYTINIDLTSIINSVFNGYGAFRQGRLVSLDKNGKARVCGLWPGAYRFTIQPQNNARQPGVYYGGGEFTITDKDLTSLAAKVGPTFNWNGEIVIEGPAPAKPIEQKMQVGFTNITPTSLGIAIQSEIPGKFTLPNLHYDRELLRFGNLPDGWYVKSAMYGTRDLTQLGGRFMLDTPDVPLKVVLDPKGGRIKVKVTNDKGEPVAGERVNLIPGQTATAQQLIARLWSCYTDDKGECTVFTLPNETPKSVFPPGLYMVLAADIPYNQSADVLDQVWKTFQTEGAKVTLPPGATGEVSIRQTTLRK